jgi:flagellar biosynthesis protein FliR
MNEKLVGCCNVINNSKYLTLQLWDFSLLHVGQYPAHGQFLNVTATIIFLSMDLQRYIFIALKTQFLSQKLFIVLYYFCMCVSMLRQSVWQKCSIHVSGAVLQEYLTGMWNFICAVKCVWAISRISTE